jgi:hypothetical protein
MANRTKRSRQSPAAASQRCPEKALDIGRHKIN